MANFNSKTRVRAGTPIEVGERRFLPSVLMTSIEGHLINDIASKAPAKLSISSALQGVRLRPISVVEQGPEGNRWHAIPDATRDTLSIMAASGLTLAMVSILIILLTKIARR